MTWGWSFDGFGFLAFLGSSQAGNPPASSLPSLQQIRRNQATAVVLLGVIGAEYGQEIPHTSSSAAAATPVAAAGQRHPPEGFSKTDYSLARATSKTLFWMEEE